MHVKSVLVYDKYSAIIDYQSIWTNWTTVHWGLWERVGTIGLISVELIIYQKLSFRRLGSFVDEIPKNKNLIPKKVGMLIYIDGSGCVFYAPLLELAYA